MNSVVVVIPIHSEEPSYFELISFEQCFRILHHYPIKVLAPVGLNLNAYKSVVNSFDIVFIDKKWQSSLVSYNKLKISRFFYNLFKSYNYLLTYELDAFIFKDDLENWCAKGFDYIGAPWFEGFADPTPDNKIIGVGNSGFSLRNVKTISKVLRSVNYCGPYVYNGKKNHLRYKLNKGLNWILNQTGENYSIQKNCKVYEDIFLSQYIPIEFKNFQLAPISEAIKFSFEVNPSILFEKNNFQLPTGCHAWWRYDLNFWKPFIEKFGYNLAA